MSERLGLPVYVDNDVNVALPAEHRRGAAMGARHALMLALGTGIGGGLLLDGRLYRGANGFAAAELGHVVLDLDGPDRQGAVLGAAACGGDGIRNRDRARRRARGPAPPRLELGARLANGAQISGALVTELAQ